MSKMPRVAHDLVPGSECYISRVGSGVDRKIWLPNDGAESVQPT
jgi:hypothetical protein